MSYQLRATVNNLHGEAAEELLQRFHALAVNCHPSDVFCEILWVDEDDDNTVEDSLQSLDEQNLLQVVDNYPSEEESETQQEYTTLLSNKTRLFHSVE